MNDLLRVNRLPSRMVYPGQTIYIKPGNEACAKLLRSLSQTDVPAADRGSAATATSTGDAGDAAPGADADEERVPRVRATSDTGVR